jgi:hypothetical protein
VTPGWRVAAPKPPPARQIPVLVAGGGTARGEQAILGYLDEHCMNTPDAANQRAKAAEAKRKELEAACLKWTETPTP